MTSRSRVHGFAAALCAAFLALLASRAGAEEKVVNLTFTAKTDPAVVEPGGKGTLVLTGDIRPTVHVYSNPGQWQVKPVPATGVTYGDIEASPTQDWRDPEFPDEPAEKVWMGKVVLKIPFSVSADAKAPVKVGAAVSFSACDEGQCYAKETLTVVVDPAASAAGASPAAGTTPAPAPPSPEPPATNGSATSTNGSGSPTNGSGGAPSPVPAGMALAPDGAPGAARPVSDTVSFEGKAASATATFHADRVDVEIVPKEGYHLYPIGYVGTGRGIEVSGTPASGIRWKSAHSTALHDGDVTEPYPVRVPFVRENGSAPVRLLVTWQGCNDGQCLTDSFALVHDEQGARLDVPAKPATPTPVAAGARKDRGLLFDSMSKGTLTPAGTIVGPDYEPKGKAQEPNWIDNLWKEWGILFLGPIFLAGLLLAFTPCVLPIIPITVSIIGGGRADLPRARLTMLLSFYALGLSMAYGVLGLLAGTGGASLTSAFQSPIAIYVIAGVFFLLSLGMFGIYELQPPAWMQRIQGGAKGGSPVGSFLFGAMAAVIASPCTGPAIVGMLVFIAQSGNHLLGFLMFFTLGLGMSSVFFAAGSFNLLMRPGPWMVWVRWSFGVVMIAAAFYYVASADRLSGTALYVVGAIVSAAVAYGTWRHLAKKEMDEGATKKSLALAGVLMASVVGVGLITRTDRTWWTDLRDRDHLVAAVEKARAEGKVTVVDVWATWCTYCRKYDHVIEEDPALVAAFDKMSRLRINVQSDDRLDLRDGVGIPANAQPFLLFIDANGVIQRDQDVDTWFKSESGAEIARRLKAMGVPVGPKPEAAAK